LYKEEGYIRCKDSQVTEVCETEEIINSLFTVLTAYYTDKKSMIYRL